MKMPGSIRKQMGIRHVSGVVIVALGALLFFSIGTALAASGGEPGPKGWVNTDWFRVLNFAFLAGALFFLLRKPVSEALRSRIAGIKEQLEDLESRKEETEKKLLAYNEKLSQLEKEAEKIVADYVKQGNEAKQRILKEAQAAAEKLQDQAQRNIEREFERARQQLQEEILEKSLVRAEAIIKKKIKAADQNRLVKEYLEKVVV